jgi:hypothetical protein
MARGDARSTRMRNNVFDQCIYIIDWVESYTGPNGVVTKVKHRDVAQAFIDANEDSVSWMILGQEWAGVDHKANAVVVQRLVDLVNLELKKGVWY